MKAIPINDVSGLMLVVIVWKEKRNIDIKPLYSKFSKHPFTQGILKVCMFNGKSKKYTKIAEDFYKQVRISFPLEENE